ncbi:MAG: SRPBCC family protein [Lysobacter sp.]|nr:SRPBCC family protein [Lysobacter sp.]
MSDVGSGRQTIVDSVPGRRIVSKLEFEGQDEATATFVLTPQGQGTRVVWSFDADHGTNPASRWFGLLFDRMIGPNYEQGLAKLKTTMESDAR